MESSALRKLEDRVRTEGEAKGEARGEAKGRAKGKNEEKITIAKKMLQMNIDINTISAATGLDKEKVSKLKL
jgi:transcription antitermination factor NusA-like protein